MEWVEQVDFIETSKFKLQLNEGDCGGGGGDSLHNKQEEEKKRLRCVVLAENTSQLRPFFAEIDCPHLFNHEGT